MMRRIGILALVSKYGGGMYQYVMSLLDALNKYCQGYEFILIRNSEFPNNFFKETVEINPKKTKLPLKLKRFFYANFRIKLGDLLGEYKTCVSNELDLLIAPYMSLIPFYMEKPYIVVIHDLQHKYFPNFFSLKERVTRDYVFKRTVRFSKIVVCESEHVKNDIIKYIKVAENKIRVIQSPPPPYIFESIINEDRFSTIRDKYNLPDRFLFYPAQFWPHKNHINLIKAIYILKHKSKFEINLILCGSKGQSSKDVMKEVEKMDMKKFIKYLGYVPEEDIPYLYKLSVALVMPTLFESVSMPIWEAFYLNVPVVSSNVCALPEQVGEAALLFNPYNIDDIAEKIYKILTDENLRKTLTIKGMERIKKLTPENYAIQWRRILDEIFNEIKS